jgi:ATP-binding cassette subfamily G (WHITE) protein 2
MSNAKTVGKAEMNGAIYGSAQLKAVSGYVMQDDLLNGNLTVQETLDYTAELRLPESVSAAEKKRRVDEAIAKVGLAHVRNVIIGNPMKKGVSGGQRKRVCVAMELLTHPRLLFLDEPTSGLDSVTALALTKILQKLADSGECTVVCTIHQPQSKIFELFDDLMLLKDGHIVYYGQAANAVDFFAEAGFPCPPRTNPADHFLDVITPQPGQKEFVAVQNVFHSENDKRLAKVFKPVDKTAEKDYERYGGLMIHERPSWWHQFKTLTRRCFIDNIRSWPVLMTLLIQNILMALLIGGAFFQIGTSQKSQVRRQPVMFFVVINQGVFAALSVINSFPSERLLILRERAAGTYNVSAYYLAKNVADLLLQIPGPVIFSPIVYFMVGLQPVASKFFMFTFFMILDSLTAVSLALMVSALARTTTLSVTILPMTLEICRLFGGFFLSPANLPIYFSWLDALSYVKYCYVGIALNELNGLELDPCAPNTTCLYPDGGETVIQNLGLNKLSIGGCVGALIAFIIGFRFIAYIGIRYIKW